MKRGDCLPRLRACLEEEGLLQAGESEDLDREARAAVEHALAAALAAPEADPAAAAYPVYAEDVRRG